MLCAITSQVLSVRGPVESEFSLDHETAKPMEFHVHRFDVLGENGIFGDSHSGGIVGLEGILPLGSFHFYESLA